LLETLSCEQRIITNVTIRKTVESEKDDERMKEKKEKRNKVRM